MNGSGGGLWWPMLEADLGPVHTMSGEIHPDFPEREAVFAEKLALYPAGCRVLWLDGNRAGYVFSHPWAALSPPSLDRFLQALPETPATYYLHDMALLPAARGSGAGQQAAQDLIRHAQQLRLPDVSLVAVNQSPAFWMKMQFQVIDNSEIRAKLACYGSDAAFMVRTLP